MISFCLALATFFFPGSDATGTFITSEAPFTIVCDDEYNCWSFDDGDNQCVIFLDGNGGSTDNGACGDKVGN